MSLEKYKKDFPILEKSNLIYFDNACMTLRPKQVIEEMNRYYYEFPACTGRSMHRLATMATDEMEKAREKVRKFLNAGKKEEIVFTKNTTEAINLIANSFKFEKDSVVVTSDREHNSNLLPWQLLHKKKGVRHLVCKSNALEEFSLENFSEMFRNNNVALVSMVHCSNIDGYELPVKEIIKIAHENNAVVLLDAAQSAPHKKVDVKKLDADFLAFSGHKACGPSGTGILYGKKGLLEKLDLFFVGGSTVTNSSYESAEIEKVPARFEAGLQNIAGNIGFGKACEYLQEIGLEKIETHEMELNKLLQEGLQEIDKVELIGVKDANKKTGITSFNLGKMNPVDLCIMLSSSRNIALRGGMHCVHSWFNSRKLRGSARASLYFYNTKEEVKIFLEEIKKVARIA